MSVEWCGVVSSLRLGWRPLARTSKPSTSGACVCVCACYHSCGASEGCMQEVVVVVVLWVCALYVCCKKYEYVCMCSPLLVAIYGLMCPSSL